MLVILPDAFFPPATRTDLGREHDMEAALLFRPGIWRHRATIYLQFGNRLLVELRMQRACNVLSVSTRNYLEGQLRT